MIVIAGPPGSGKSTAFPVSSFGVASFDADDRAAELNKGSDVGITNTIRHQVNREFEAFVAGRIGRGESFAIETILRSHVTFEQARLAKTVGFEVEMRYMALADFRMHLERVKARADAGGHSASEPALRSIHDASLSNLPQAVVEVDQLWVYDNTTLGGPPWPIMEAKAGRIVFLEDPPPQWLATAFVWV
ncbi:MAG: hypothetical protein IPM24_16355 [Bryobacterales bacterium]|nr:hypothetical protein [Bryobacterales bacterium]